MESDLLISLLRIVLAVVVLLVAAWVYIAQPSSRKNQPSAILVDESRLRAHVETLSEKIYPRNYRSIENLNAAADYIFHHFEKAGGSVSVQEFDVAGKGYKNVIALFGRGKPGKIIVGAHYDTFEFTPGANDNGSGVAGLLELAYLLGEQGTAREVELVAYALEEPPYYTTPNMGSCVHAARIAQAASEISGVIVLETIGYFSDAPGSQSYPMPLLRLFYPSRADFIAVVGRLDQRRFTKKVKLGMQGVTDLPVFSVNAPSFVPGVDFSDHRNYWPLGINAVMITDTAFYRYPEYHTVRDTADRLDYRRLAQVVVAVFAALPKI